MDPSAGPEAGADQPPHPAPPPQPGPGMGLIPEEAGPEVIEQLVEELKSQGVFDKVRNECLAEVDTKVSPVFRNRTVKLKKKEKC